MNNTAQQLERNAWKYATVVVIAIIILNPELAELALFIDAVGLEMFFVLIEVQILLTFALFYEKIKQITAYIKKIFTPKITLHDVRKNPDSILFLVPTQTTVMHLLVLSFIIFLSFHDSLVGFIKGTLHG